MLAALAIISCADDEPKKEIQDAAPRPKPQVQKEYGYTFDDYNVVRDTVKSGDSFGQIMFNNGIDYVTIQKITESSEGVFDTRKIDMGKPYVLLKAKDTTDKAKVFIYEQNKIDYVIVDLQDSRKVENKKKPVTLVEKTAYGVINDNLSSTFDELGLSVTLSYKIADIYAWTIDFFHLQAGDRFKVVYTEKFINDTIPAGIDKIKASWFEHKGKPVYAFRYRNDSLPNAIDFYDEEANNLRRAFLKGPLKFNRVSSRYNLRRRIAYYGNKIRPHRGTDFAGAVGTPIMTTANGTVIKSEYRGGNGNYVKIRHNSTYETQYLHMSKRAVKVGDYVQQGDIIGYIGMTGNTSGPHVCYRFWKNGVQVDPFKQDLPLSQPLEDSLKPDYFKHIEPLKIQLDNLNFEEIL